MVVKVCLPMGSCADHYHPVEHLLGTWELLHYDEALGRGVMYSREHRVLHNCSHLRQQALGQKVL